MGCMKNLPTLQVPSSTLISEAKTWTDVACIREAMGLSQSALGARMGIDQSQVSRGERQGRALTEDERGKLLDLSELLAEQPFGKTMGRLRKAQVVAQSLQSALGGVVGSMMYVALPSTMKREIIRALLKEQDVYLTNDPNNTAKEEATANDDPMVARLKNLRRRVRQAVNEERWEDIIFMAEPAVSMMGLEDKVRVLMISIKHNFALALEMHAKEYDRARALFDQIIQEPLADERDQAIAFYEKGFTYLEEVVFPSTSLNEARAAALEAEKHFLQAAAVYPDNTCPGQAMLHLADKLIELDDAKWAKDVVEKAEEVFMNGSTEIIESKIKTWEDVRKRWPNLTRKRGLLKSVFKWLPVLVMAVGVMAHQGN